jgi:lipopolysaccharide cholinephosphotransferase
VLIVSDVPFTGVFVDIFPVDRVLDMNDFTIRHEQVLKIRRKQAFLMAIKQKRYKNIVQKTVLKIKGGFQTTEELAERINNIAKKRNYEAECPLLFELVAGSLCKSPFPKEIFNSFKSIQFENRKYMSVKDVDTYLTATFGDYMTLPPLEKRVRHHRFVAYWR